MFVALFFKIPESSWNAYVIALTKTLRITIRIRILKLMALVSQITGKSLGGSVCLYVNFCWCKTVKVRESICSHNEFLSVSLCPFFLPWEIPQVFLTVVYIHPRANMAEAASSIANVAHRLQSICPDAPHLILGDFNTCSLNQHLSHLYQYVECPTGHGRTLNL